MSSSQVVPAFRSFQLAGHSSFQVVPAFRSFQLSGRSSFQVVQAFRSFQLSGRSSFQVIPAFWSIQLSGRSSFQVIPASGRSIFQVIPAFRSFRHCGRPNQFGFLVVSVALVIPGLSITAYILLVLSWQFASSFIFFIGYRHYAVRSRQNIFSSWWPNWKEKIQHHSPRPIPNVCHFHPPPPTLSHYIFSFRFW